MNELLQEPAGLDSFAPISFEADATFLPVRGELPAGLEGTLYRNGPNPQFPLAGAHLFGGDGMLHAFTLQGGRASYRNRWVRTGGWQVEHAAGRRLFDEFGRPMDPDGPATQAPDDGAANTHIVAHAGRLFALEEAHLPVEIEPGTLATLGACDFGGAISGPFTAHPKRDPQTGELLFFGYGSPEPFSPGMTYGKLDAAGRVTRFERFEAPFASMVHDFAITQGHVLFPIQPLTGSMPRAMKGLPPYAWEPELGTRVGIMARDGRTQDIRWFEGEAGYVFHFINAWEEADARGHRCIVADVMQFGQPPLFPYADGSPTDPKRQVARPVRWRFDLDAPDSAFTQRPMNDLAGEFPRIDERFTGRAYRHAWYACQRDPHQADCDGVAHFDPASGHCRSFFMPVGDAVSEPVFVPHAPDAPEGAGWLLATVLRAATQCSELVVFDAQALEEGPIAAVQLSHRVPAGFHGSWVPAR